ncbi:hypothetical protein AAU61_02800 [Desulfocarbo indianensis]|nr:hypothetical protein AAU61_02800 [Desulfocarbo indianensis]
MAADFVWVGAGGGGDGSSWDDALNWDLAAGFPGAGDTVRFNSNAAVTLGADRVVDAVYLATQDTAFDGGEAFYSPPPP